MDSTKSSMNVLRVLMILLLLVSFSPVNAGGEEADVSKTSEMASKEAASDVDILSMKPAEVVETVPKGGIVNPFDPADPAMAEAGHVVFMETSCNGCHGGTGGGGMGPPLSNKRWVYGDDADTLFRLITLGTIELQNKGYTRKARENVRAPMPAQASGAIVIESLTTERILKIITWIQSLHIDKS